METVYNLNRFLEAQKTKFNDALSEIKNGSNLLHRNIENIDFLFG